MLFEGIHHIAIVGSEYYRSRYFYVDILGFKVIRENVRQDKKDIKIDLQCGDQEIELFIKDGSPNRLSHPEALGLRHIAFRTNNIESAILKLYKLGIFTEPIRLDNFTDRKITFFHDPDGLPIEIYE